MSQANVHHLSGSKAGQNLDSLLDALPGLLSTATTQYVGLLRRGVRLVGDAVPASLRALGSGNDCCTVPTQDCPPRCVAVISWEACAGEVQRAVITVKNTGQQTRDFSFTATALGPVQPELAPPSAQLAPGQTVAVQVSVPANEGFKAGETYTGEIAIRGAYEQCVKLALHIDTPQVAKVDVCQGEAPQHITELKWYRHFQCTQPCDAGPTQSPGASGGTVEHPGKTHG